MWPQPFPQMFPKLLGKQKGPATLYAASPLLIRCWRQDLNLHSLDGNQALNLARLPIPPLQLPRSLCPSPRAMASPRRDSRRTFHTPDGLTPPAPTARAASRRPPPALPDTPSSAAAPPTPSPLPRSTWPDARTAP